MGTGIQHQTPIDSLLIRLRLYYLKGKFLFAVMAEGIRLLPNRTSYETNYDVVLCEFVLSEEKVFIDWENSSDRPFNLEQQLVKLEKMTNSSYDAETWWTKVNIMLVLFCVVIVPFPLLFLVTQKLEIEFWHPCFSKCPWA